MLSTEQDREVREIVQKCIKELGATFGLLIGVAYDQIKKAFGEHRLYVLFEPRLNCDPETDHINPKNVYPLF